MTLTRRSALALPVLALFPAAALAAPAPGFSLKDADGRTRTLAEFRGKVVVLEWINEGCPYVKKHYTGNMQATQKAAEQNAKARDEGFDDPCHGYRRL